MRNYIILNGNNSVNIQGLLIQNLPPIVKPKIRTQVEEIDGRDGDIVTTLGYSAYDKEFSIGLYGDFDINEVIAFFNSSGIVTFSNEPDKYYNYEIVEQIDFERLIRFRTATITMHVQPFKYSAEDNSKTFNFDTTNIFNFSNWYNNKSVLSVTSGEFTITENSLTMTGSNAMFLGTYSGSRTPTQADIDTINTFGIEIDADTQYTLSVNSNNDGDIYVMYYDENYSYTTRKLFFLDEGNNQLTFTTPSNCKYVCLRVVSGFNVPLTLSNFAIQKNTSASFDIYNSGNIYSKPILTITGGGNIGVYLNNVQLFSIELGTLGSITIDTNKMEAYNDTTLLNRLVTGNYDNFKLNIGKNNINLSGSITEVNIQNFSRWI